MLHLNNISGTLSDRLRNLLRDLFRGLTTVSPSAILEREPRWVNEVLVMLDLLHRAVYQPVFSRSKTLLVLNVIQWFSYLHSFDTIDIIHFMWCLLADFSRVDTKPPSMCIQSYVVNSYWHPRLTVKCFFAVWMWSDWWLPASDVRTTQLWSRHSDKTSPTNRDGPIEEEERQLIYLHVLRHASIIHSNRFAVVERSALIAGSGLCHLTWSWLL